MAASFRIYQKSWEQRNNYRWQTFGSDSRGRRANWKWSDKASWGCHIRRGELLLEITKNLQWKIPLWLWYAEVNIIIGKIIEIPELLHYGMRDESWNFLSTFLEIWTNCTVFGVEFNGIIRIFNFRQAITSKFKKNWNIW